MAKAGEAKKRFDTQSPGSEQRSDFKITHSSESLRVVFSSPKSSVPQELDLTPWLRVGSMAVDMARAFAETYGTAARQTRLTVARNFLNGLVHYLTTHSIKLDQPEDIARDLLVGFFNHLKARKTAEGEPIGDDTRLHYWRYAVPIIELVVAKYPGTPLDVPKRPFAGTNFRAKPPKVVDRESINRTLKTAAEDAIDLISFIDPLMPRIKEAITRIEDGDCWNPDRIEEVAAALLLEIEEGVPPRSALLRTKIGKAVDIHGYEAICRLVWPSTTDLMPFFLLLASHSGWNEQPLAHLRVSNCVVRSVVGSDRLTISSEKYRANSIVRRSFAITDKLLSPNEIIEFVKRWTSVLRSRARPLLQDDLWLHRVNTSRRTTENPSPIDSLAGRFREGSVTPSNHVQYYCKKRGLKFTGLRELRQCFAETVSDATGGDALALREMLGHTRTSIVNRHYKTADMKQQGAEALAGVQTARERWVASGGKIDTRNANSKRDQTAATPGFICIDPFDSPRHGQRKGRMCYAYGHCPSCPLAVSDPDATYALGRFLQLAELYEQAKSRLGIAVWKAKFSADSAMLSNQWIPALSQPATLEMAGKLLLPPLPELE